MNAVNFFYFSNDPSSTIKASGDIEWHGLTVKFLLKHGKYGYFAEFGNSQKGKDGKYYNGAFFKDKAVRTAVVEKIVAEYELKREQVSPTV